MAASLELHIPLEAATNREDVAAYKEREAKRQRLKEEQVRVVCDSLLSWFAASLDDSNRERWLPARSERPSGNASRRSRYAAVSNAVSAVTMNSNFGMAVTSGSLGATSTQQRPTRSCLLTTVLLCCHALCMQASAYIGADSSLDATSDPAASVVLLPGDSSGAGGAADAAAAAAAAVKSGAAESPVLPIVPFEACLNKFTAAEVRSVLHMCSRFKM
jgi:hypothetical protein